MEQGDTCAHFLTFFFPEHAVGLNPFHGYSSKVPLFPHLFSLFSLSPHFKQLHSLLASCFVKTYSSANKTVSLPFELC